MSRGYYLKHGGKALPGMVTCDGCGADLGQRQDHTAGCKRRDRLAELPAGAKAAELVTYTIDYVNDGGPMTIPASDYMAAISVLNQAVRNHATYARVIRNDTGAAICIFKLGGLAPADLTAPR
jgi:hypothetical protein